MTPPQRSVDRARYAALAQVGTEMVAPLIVGLVLDFQLDTKPWLTLAGVVLGFAGGLYHLVAVLVRKPPAGPPESPSNTNRQ